jgi:PAS domain S-box-containing protein
MKDAISETAVVKDKNGAIVYTITIAAVNYAGARLQRLAIYDALIRIAGLIAGLLVAYLFIRSVMNPYRKIKKEASLLNLPQVNLEDADGVEYAVRMFQEVIRELRQKESLLQAMYDNSEKRADSLARYNEYILGSISSGVIICDNQGIVTRFNPAAEKIVGIKEQLIQGKHFGDVFGKKHKISIVLSEALDHDRTFSRTEFEISREDGEKLWIGLSSSLISDNRGEKVGAAVLLTDLTSIKRLQEISDFTEKMAALGEMSAGLAHE